MFCLATIFQSGMVLQREKPIRIFGNSDAAETLTILLNGYTIAKESIESGSFSVFLPSQPAMENVTLTIQGLSGHEIILSQVDIGEVWIAGGQSNMELKLKFVDNADAVIAAADDIHFRHYIVAQWAFDGEEEEGFRDVSAWDSWKKWSPENAPDFSSTASFFALQLRKELGIPVGIVGCYSGGTPAATWLDDSYLRDDESLKVFVDEYEQGLMNMDIEDNNIFAKQMRMAMFSSEAVKRDELAMQGKIEEPSFNPADAKTPEQAEQMKAMVRFFMQTGPTSPNRPAGLYRTMVQKVAGYSCRGIIWYQGEADYRKAELYKKLFTAVITCWRRDWDEELPFLFVQLAPFSSWRGATGERFPEVREAQEQVSKTVPNTWMASIMDIGAGYDIHPRNKKPVGERLSLLARGKVYGEDILCEAPEFEKAVPSDGKLTLTFRNTGAGLHIANGKLNAFELFVDGKSVEIYTEVAKNAELIIRSDVLTASSQVEVRFAWVGYCEVNLYNSAGLTAKPFVWKK